jgi:hypothetical protein
MSAADPPSIKRWWSRDDSRDIERVKTPSRANNIYERVNHTHFMKVYVEWINAMRSPFGFTQHLKDHTPDFAWTNSCHFDFKAISPRPGYHLGRIQEAICKRYLKGNWFREHSIIVSKLILNVDEEPVEGTRFHVTSCKLHHLDLTCPLQRSTYKSAAGTTHCPSR